MDVWMIVLAVALSALLLAACALTICLRFRYLRALRVEGIHYAEILRSRSPKSSKSALKLCNRHAFEDAHPPAKTFSWSDHPSLIAEALEHGWPTFAFTYADGSTPSKRRKLCARCTQEDDAYRVEPQITWETGSGFSYKQKLRLNPGLITPRQAVQALQTALPLPGPSQLRFPQESYFEIIIVAEGAKASFEEAGFAEHCDSGKFISELPLNSEDRRLYSSNSASPSRSPRLGRSGSENSHYDAPRARVSQGSKKITAENDPKIVAVGHAAFSSRKIGRLPGLDSGSVGFHSTGIVFLNGEPRADRQCSSAGWGCAGNVVGCGFDPATRQVFFTFNGECVHRVMCRNPEFGGPLYPTIAANCDVTVLVNFGQDRFEYAPANAQRLCDPSAVQRKSICHSRRDSGDLFSVERIDTDCFELKEKFAGMGIRTKDIESPELFEIVLDRGA